MTPLTLPSQLDWLSIRHAYVEWRKEYNEGILPNVCHRPKALCGPHLPHAVSPWVCFGWWWVSQMSVSWSMQWDWVSKCAKMWIGGCDLLQATVPPHPSMWVQGVSMQQRLVKKSPSLMEPKCPYCETNESSQHCHTHLSSLQGFQQKFCVHFSSSQTCRVLSPPIQCSWSP